jgi:hypothetical protein
MPARMKDIARDLGVSRPWSVLLQSKVVPRAATRRTQPPG